MNIEGDFFEVVYRRRSIRRFKDKKVPANEVESILKAIQTAPTAGNLQAYQVYLVEESKKIRALGRAAYDQPCVYRAAAVLVFCTDALRSQVEYGERGVNLYCLQDTTIAATIAHLATFALGLGSVMVGAFNEKAVANAVGAAPSQRPILMLPFGYPAESPAPTDRRPLDDLVIRI